jgi:hypothetical protein
MAAEVMDGTSSGRKDLTSLFSPALFSISRASARQSYGVHRETPRSRGGPSLANEAGQCRRTYRSLSARPPARPCRISQTLTSSPLCFVSFNGGRHWHGVRGVGCAVKKNYLTNLWLGALARPSKFDCVYSAFFRNLFLRRIIVF